MDSHECGEYPGILRFFCPFSRCLDAFSRSEFGLRPCFRLVTPVEHFFTTPKPPSPCSSHLETSSPTPHRSTLHSFPQGLTPLTCASDDHPRRTLRVTLRYGEVGVDWSLLLCAYNFDRLSTTRSDCRSFVTYKWHLEGCNSLANAIRRIQRHRPRGTAFGAHQRMGLAHLSGARRSGWALPWTLSGAPIFRTVSHFGRWLSYYPCVVLSCEYY